MGERAKLKSKLKKEETLFWLMYQTEDIDPVDLLDKAIKIMRIQKNLIEELEDTVIYSISLTDEPMSPTPPTEDWCEE